MSVWATTDVLHAKNYVHPGYDPRKKADRDEIQLAMVADYVYKDDGDGYAVLPYVRLSLGRDSVVLTEAQARQLADALDNFVYMTPKWRGKPRKESA